MNDMAVGSNIPIGAPQALAASESAQLLQWEEGINALIRSKGGSVSAREFQQTLNVLFHDIEAAHYDRLHEEMWNSLPPVFDRLASDIESAIPGRSHLTLTDIGCGTGLATELLLRTTLKERISNLQMVDTSSEMLNRCRKTAEAWRLPTSFMHDQVDNLPDDSVDILITCSVLHHIPELVGFCRSVQRVLRRGGIFVHIHDPRREAGGSEVVRGRIAALSELRKQEKARISRLPRRIIGVLGRHIRRFVKREYLDDVNRRLIDTGMIKRPLSPSEIWSITDLRVGDLPYSATDGISMDELAIALEDFDCLSVHTYGFFGVLGSNLPPVLDAEEQRLFAESSGDGVFLAGAWVRRDPSSKAT